jgi:hypothetical protein
MGIHFTVKDIISPLIVAFLIRKLCEVTILFSLKEVQSGFQCREKLLLPQARKCIAPIGEGM